MGEGCPLWLGQQPQEGWKRTPARLARSAKSTPVIHKVACHSQLALTSTCSLVVLSGDTWLQICFLHVICSLTHCFMYFRKSWPDWTNLSIFSNGKSKNIFEKVLWWKNISEMGWGGWAKNTTKITPCHKPHSRDLFGGWVLPLSKDGVSTRPGPGGRLYRGYGACTQGKYGSGRAIGSESLKGWVLQGTWFWNGGKGLVVVLSVPNNFPACF